MPFFQKSALCFFLITFYSTVFSQTISIQDSSGKTILLLEKDRLKSAEDSSVIFTIKGNIVFEGASDNQKDIALLIKTDNIFSKKKIGYGLDAKQENTLFSMRNGGFFYREQNTFQQDWLMAHFRKDDKGSYELYREDSDDVLCRFFTPAITTGNLAAIAFHFIRSEELDLAKAERLKFSGDATTDITKTSGSIRRFWNTGMDDFSWDGYVFKRRWNSFDYEEWTFDGTVLKRLWYPGEEEYIWDGSILRNRWYASYDEFEWNGTTLRRRFGTSADEFILQGNIVKRSFDGSGRDDWQIDGNLPIPLIALVVFGLIRK